MCISSSKVGIDVSQPGSSTFNLQDTLDKKMNRKARPSVKAHQMLNFLHEKESFTLRQYCEIYKHALPSVIMVTQGFYGDSELEIMGNGQVLRIHSCVYQKRAVATDSHNRTLSVPLNYPLLFKVLDSKNRVGKDEDTISNIVAKKPLPVKIQLSESTHITFSMNAEGLGSPERTHSLGPLIVKEIYEETYFLANAICYTDGKANDIATLIPLYLGDILVAPVTGIEGKTKPEWDDYLAKLREDCKKVQIPLDTGLKEIAIFSPSSIKSSENIYEYLEPSSYIVSNWEGKTNCDTQYATKSSIKPPPLKPKPKPKSTDTPTGEPPAIPARQMKPLPKPVTPSADKPNPFYANAIERATVPPFTQMAEEAAAKVATGSGVTSKAGLQKETPIHEMSIDELGGKLKELKLEKYLKVFKDQGVDGELAAELDETILQEDFKFTKFESIKFMKFVKSGHIPK